MNLPGVDAPTMPAKLQKSLNSMCHLKPEKIRDWVGFTLDGTTFSGHPTRTTLGNTFRSLLYAYFYLESIGIHEPWKTNDSCYVAASGDDVVMWIRDGLQDKLASAVRNLTAKKKSDKVFIGLGQ